MVPLGTYLRIRLFSFVSSSSTVSGFVGASGAATAIATVWMLNYRKFAVPLTPKFKMPLGVSSRDEGNARRNDWYERTVHSRYPCCGVLTSFVLSSRHVFRLCSSSVVVVG